MTSVPVLFMRHVFPGVCIACATRLAPHETTDLCDYCRADLPRVQNPCPRCALPRPDRYANGIAVAAKSSPCARCATAPPAFFRATVPLRYEGLVTTWIHALKNQLGMVEGRVLGELLADAAADSANSGGAPDLLVPVPLRWSRLALRGHNQALTLGRHVARALGVPIDAHVVHRAGRAPSQRGLGREARRRNLAGVFTASPIVAGRRVAIVDDVMTTGSTAEALARTLLSAGARDVQVFAVARATLLQNGQHGIPSL
jgi:ComF family protein